MFAYLDSLCAEFATTFLDPSKRVFWGYLLVAAAIGGCVLLKSGAGASALRSLVTPRIWWSESARADYKILTINKALFLLLSPWLLSQLAVAGFVFEFLHQWSGARPRSPDWPAWCVPAGFTLALFLVDDFARFFVHRLLHRVPLLWAFHQVHHSARTLSPLTVLRTHPVEGIVFSLRSSVVNGVCVAAFIFFFDDQVDLVTVLGGNVIVFAFNIAGANLRHSHLHFRYWPVLERWLISPAQHQLHHSADPRHYDCNFGSALAVWDRLLGSWRPSEDKPPARFGTHRVRQPNEQSLATLYWQPFVQAGRIIVRRQRRLTAHVSGWVTSSPPVQQVDEERRADAGNEDAGGQILR